jgi:hypothetical protein
MGAPAGLAEELRRALDRLSLAPELEQYYLAGGTAIGLHLGHRRSRDLDFFSLSPQADLDALRASIVSRGEGVQVVQQTDVTLRLLCDGAPVDFVRYRYLPLEPLAPGPSGVALAGKLDLAAMKLSAIARRGIRRDFWDLFAIAQSGLALASCGRGYVEKYGVNEADLYHILRSLTYFDDAEKDPIYPAGLSAAAWEEIKAFFLREAPTLLGLGCRGR